LVSLQNSDLAIKEPLLMYAITENDAIVYEYTMNSFDGFQNGYVGLLIHSK